MKPAGEAEEACCVATVMMDTGGDTDISMSQLSLGPEFTSLPDVVLVKILTYLSVRERYTMCQTCQTFYQLFSHPSLWHTVKIHLLGDMDMYKVSEVFSPNRHLAMAKQFGAYFQNLTVIISGYFHKLPELCREVLEELTQVCRLETLTLEIGVTPTKMDLHIGRDQVLTESDLDIFLSLVSKAYRLHGFNLVSWPNYPGMESADILGALRANPRIQNLEKICLFCQDPSTTTWASMNAMLPKPDQFLTLVNHFTCLESVSFRANMIDADVIRAFAHPGRVPLKRMCVMVTHSRHDSSFAIPLIPGESWRMLRNSSPELKVEVIFVNRIPVDEKASFLKPEIPVSALCYMKYSNCSDQDLVLNSEKFSQTLEHFVDYSDSNYNDALLVDMVAKCPKLTRLIFWGEISFENALKLAKLRGQRWEEFVLMEDNIVIDELDPEPDQDRVIGQDSSGEYYLVRAAREQQSPSEEEILQCLEKLKGDVSQELGYNWTPLGKGDHLKPKWIF